MRIKLGSFFFITLLSSQEVGATLPLTHEFTIQCQSMVVGGDRTIERKTKITGKNGNILHFTQDGKQGMVSQIIEAERKKEYQEEFQYEINHASFQAVSEHEHMKTYESIFYDISSSSLTWEVAMINTSRNILTSTKTFEFKNCLNIGLD